MQLLPKIVEEKRNVLLENNAVYELNTERWNNRFYIYHGDRVLI